MRFKKSLIGLLLLGVGLLGCSRDTPTSESEKPVWLRINYDGISVLLEWDYDYLDSFDGFAVYRSQSVATNLSQINDDLVDPSIFSYEDEVVTASNTYYYRIVVVTDNVEVSTSNAIGITVY